MGVLRNVFHVNRQLAAVAAETNGKAKYHRPATPPRHPRPDAMRLGVQNGTTFHFGLHCGSRLLHPVSMKNLTAKQISSVPCPTCGVAAGKRCVLLSGAPRKEPHVDRKIAATEAVKKERFRPAAD